MVRQEVYYWRYAITTLYGLSARESAVSEALVAEEVIVSGRSIGIRHLFGPVQLT